MLDDLNREFNTPTPGIGALAPRLQRLLGADPDLAVLAVGDPPAGVAAVSFRPRVWHDGPVGTLDERYVQANLRRQGLGSVLLEAVEDPVRRRGEKKLQINVNVADVDARRFYERHRYRNADSGREPFGGSKRAGRRPTRAESCSLVTLTTGEPSRSCHGEGPRPTDRPIPEMPRAESPQGTGSGTYAQWIRNSRGPSPLPASSAKTVGIRQRCSSTEASGSPTGS
jgi:GNAT superfamily N-acetyltransferase